MLGRGGVPWCPQVSHICSCLCQEPPPSQATYVDNLELVFITMAKQNKAKQCEGFQQQFSSCCCSSGPAVWGGGVGYGWVFSYGGLGFDCLITVTDVGRGWIPLVADQQKRTSKFASGDMSWCLGGGWTWGDRGDLPWQYQCVCLCAAVVALAAWDELITCKWCLRTTENGCVKIQMMRESLSVISVY